MTQLNLSSLENALKQLEQGFEEARLNPNSEIIRDGVMQRFEYSMDLCWKMIQRYLRVIAQIDDANIRTKKDLFREAARLKLITDAEAWIGHYEARNETSHAYNKEAAELVFKRAVMFFPDAKLLLGSLRHAG
jgi:nucleotidyltransferase substrate binding protein (TIGR01987 family)